jgi:hypothetical protein
MRKKEGRNPPQDEFEQFLQGDDEVPPALRDRILKSILRKLDPSIGVTGLKLSFIHLAVSSLSLEVCSQFGLGKGEILGHSASDLEGVLCTALCGALFLGISMLTGGFILSRQEHRKLRSIGYAPVIILSLLSLVVLSAFGASMRVDEAVVWLAGAVVAGIAGLLCALQISIRVKPTIE